MQKIKTRLLMKQGSILAYSLIVVSVMIVIATSISAVTVIEKKGAVSTDSSVQAYQTADSGVQLAIKKINKKISLQEEGDHISSIFTCGNYKFQDAGAGEYELSFFSDEEGTAQITDCNNTNINQIQSIKSVGEYKDTVRAVQVSIAGPCPICSEDCNYNGDTYPTVLIGTQCWFAENLRTTKDPNGNPTTNPRICYDDGALHQDTNCNETKIVNGITMTYGGIYDWATAMNLPAACNTTVCQGSNPNPTPAELQGICPRGWHIPRRSEWQTLANLGTVPSAFGRILAGYYNSNGFPRFSLRDSDGFFLSSDEFSDIGNFYAILKSDFTVDNRLQYSKTMGSSVRCLKNN
ncbi:MAG TPA: FISUMP domain-containing protein [Candidatus Moranbacteria bacterium]|nr:FISUMP domain-containing protein [Candidatus Moranbacteria bacterium]HRY28173.1 FISUMP domain-containing protein [Candidatus Moranbacteria bacterium]